jgi:hypothetical protein
VDTGAVCSVLLHRSKTLPTGPQLSGTDGRAIPFWGTSRRRLSFGLRTFLVTFLLAAAYRPILGLDFLSAHGLLVDPVSRQVLDSKSLKPLSKPSTAAGTLRSKFAAALCSIAPSVQSLLTSFPARWRRKRKTIAEAQDTPHHRDDRPPRVCQGPPPGPGQAAPGGSRVPGTGGGQHHPPFRFALVVAAAHGPQEGRVVAALRRLPPTQPGDDTRPLPPPQHPRPLQQAAQLQVLFLLGLGEGLPSNTDGGLPFVFCYLDDIIITSHTLEEHHEHLRQIFTILQENGLQINPAKCVFAAAAAVEFLGHLAHPAPNAVLYLATDASNTHVSGVLQQLSGGSWQPLAFYSKKLSGAGTRYSTFNREMLAAFSAVRHFRFLLEGQQFRHSPTTSHRSHPCSALVGPPAATTLFHRRIHIRHQTHTRPGKRGGRSLKPPAFSSRAATAAWPADLSRSRRRGLARRGASGTGATHFGRSACDEIGSAYAQHAIKLFPSMLSIHML